MSRFISSSILPSYAGRSNATFRNSSSRSGSDILKGVMAQLPPSRHPLTERERIPPSRKSRHHAVPAICLTLRPERHVANSIATTRWRLVAAVARMLSRCRCCASRNRHRNL
jgi:hypothetical protein